MLGLAWDLTALCSVEGEKENKHLDYFGKVKYVVQYLIFIEYLLYALYLVSIHKWQAL